MKTQNLTAIYAIVAVTMLTLTTSFVSVESETGSIIDLEGDLRKGGLRSGGDPITAEQFDSYIAVTFNMNLGDIDISITDNMNDQLYNVSVNTLVQQQVNIPISGLAAGCYTITFSNWRGMMDGCFEK